MKIETKSILTLIEDYLRANPEIRFCQALQNLNINQFANMEDPSLANHTLRDNYNDSDLTVLKRIKL